MSHVSEAFGFLDELSRACRQQVLVRCVVALAPVAAFVVTVLAGADVHLWLPVLLLPFWLVSAAAPDSHAPLAVLVLLAGYWAMEVEQRIGPAVLVLAVLLLAFHVACVLASYGPPSLVLDPALLRRWLLRATACAAAAVLTWLTARLVTAADPATTVWSTATGLLVVAAWAAVLSHRLAVRADEEPG